MAVGARIDAVSFPNGPDGQMNIVKSEGEMPLPLASMGMGVNYADKQAFIAEVEALELDLLNSGKLALIQLAKAMKSDPQMGQTFINTAVGKTIVLDLTGAAVPVVVG